jgi:nitrogen fixation protein FixH
MTESQPCHSDVHHQRHHGRFWIGLVLALLGGQIALLGTMAYIAISDGSFAVEPDYYQKGLHWEDTATQLRQNVRLGWTARIDVSQAVTAAGERAVTCRLTNRDGTPLDGATIGLVAFAHARGNQRTSAELLPSGSGTYTLAMRFAHHGVWEFRVLVHRGPETFTQTMIRTVEPGDESPPLDGEG